MIRALDLADPELAERLLVVQHRAYAVEAELIGFDGIPPLQEDLADLMTSTEHWLGRFVPAEPVGAGVRGRAAGELVGAVAYELPDESTVEISRLIVDPDHARLGHARALLDHLDALHPGRTSIVSTGTANTPAVGLYLSRGYRETTRTEVAPGVHLTHFQR